MVEIWEVSQINRLLLLEDVGTFGRANSSFMPSMFSKSLKGIAVLTFENPLLRQ